MNIIELAKEAGFATSCSGTDYVCDIEDIERFAALVRAYLMKQVMDTCEAEYKMYDKMVDEDWGGHEECCALIRLMRKLDRIRPATGKASREWVDLTDDEIADAVRYSINKAGVSDCRAVIATFKEKNK